MCQMSQETSSEPAGRAQHGAGAFCLALELLISHGGEMLLSDWKDQIAQRGPSLSTAKVIQLVYGLVANSLIKIDRTQAEARAISLIDPSPE